MNDKFKNDKLKFELIRNADLVCTDCLYKYDDTNMPCNVSKCEMYEEKKKPFELMRELGMTKPTFYRYKNQIEKGC